MKTISSTTSLKAIDKAFQLASLKFSIKKLEEFTYLKQSRGIKKYGDSFRNFVTELPNGNFDETALYKAMMTAINTDEISSKISGGLGLTSIMTGVISLIPFVGTVGGVVGLTTDASSRIATAVSDRNKWWLFAPEISKNLTKKRIEELCKKK